ncbi:MAG: hypothetical protein IKB28_03890 [Clostridia bacterium]|nr:hypothetical protein [Clostridia bacterium]
MLVKTKRRVALLLSLIMVFCLMPTVVFAADTAISFEVDNSAYADGVLCGQTINLPVNVTANSGMTALNTTVAYDTDVFEAVSINGNSEFGGTFTLEGTSVFWESDDPMINNENTGLFFTITLKVKADAKGSNGVVSIGESINIADADFNDFTVAGASATITVTSPSEPVVQGYTAQVTADSVVTVNNTVTVNIGVNHSSDTTFHAAEVILEYDSTALTLDESSLSGKHYTNENGKLTFEDFDHEQNFGTGVYTFTFTANTVGDTTVTLKSAKFLHKTAASGSDLIPATINPATATITIKEETFTVTQDEDNVGITAPTEAVKNEDYTFTANDYNLYDYDITATIGGQEVAVVDNGDGTYTIEGENVTDAIVITSSRIGRTFEVTWDGDGAGDVTNEKPVEATYNGEGITFTVPTNKGATLTEDGANYSATVTIGETTTSYAAGETVTIQGSQITGDVAIVITKTTVPANGKTVTVSGADVTIKDYGNSAVVAPNTKLTLNLTVESGYTYSVKIGGQEIMNNTTTTYELTVTENATVVVTKTLDTTEVAAFDYVSVGNDQKLWLVTFKTTLAGGKVATYDGETMFWSTKYEAYCYLVSGETLSVETAKNNLDVTTAATKQVDYSGNVNKTTLTDAADAQFVANMYNGMYSQIDNTTTMEMFLSADMNGSKDVNVEDAVAIINQILGINN